MLRKAGLIIGILLISVPAFAVPVLQIGAPAGPGDTGTYADYIPTLTNPTETDTAATFGTTLYVSGVYQNKNVLNLGGQYGTGNNWGFFGYANFIGKGAILVASVPDGSPGTLTVGGASPFLTSATFSFPNNHDPVKSNISDFLFFDIGDFANNPGAVPDFASETGAADGEIKSFTIQVTGYPWVHFDVMALETGKSFATNVANNPGSKDVTWETQPVPEPATMFLLGSGLIGLAGYARRRFRK